jgi:protein ImuA
MSDYPNSIEEILDPNNRKYPPAVRRSIDKTPPPRYPNILRTLKKRYVVPITAEIHELRRALSAKQGSPVTGRSFRTGLDALNAIAPNKAFQSGAVHELLWPRRLTFPKSFALLLAMAAQNNGGAIAWSDPERELYLPSLSASGIDIRHLILLRCTSRADELWALAECLRCRGVGATVAFIERLNQIEARRLQLAAERGGGVGIFMRPYTPGTRTAYAAATRWLIRPETGGEHAQRWSVELVHGHGGRIGEILLLEVDCETRALRISAPLADRPAVPAPARTTA